MIGKLRGELHDLLEGTDHQVDGRDFTSDATGWQASGHGSHDDPDAHHELRFRLAETLSQPGAQTGSSEFTSPYLAGSNFHASSPARASGEERAGQPEADGSPAGDPAGPAVAPAE